MASEYFYQKQIGPRRTPPPKKTSLIEINGAVPDISMLSDCLTNIRVNTDGNGENYKSSRHEFESRVGDRNNSIEYDVPEHQKEDNFKQTRGHVQLSEGFDEPADDSSHILRRNSPRTVDQRMLVTHNGYNSEMRAPREESSPIHSDHNSSDFDRECKESYQKWRTKNAELFSTPGSAVHNISEPTTTRKISSNCNLSKKDPHLKDFHPSRSFQNPKQSAIDKYYEYFRNESIPHNQQYERENYNHVDEFRRRDEKIPYQTNPHQIRSKFDSRTNFRFRSDHDFRNSEESAFREYYQNNHPIPQQFKKKNLERYHQDEESTPYYESSKSCKSSRREQQIRDRDDDFGSHLNESPKLIGRHFSKEVNPRECVSNRDLISSCINEEFNRKNGYISSKALTTRKKMKKSQISPLKHSSKNSDYSCPKCDNKYQDDVNHINVKYKNGKFTSQCCGEDPDESDSSLDRCSKHFCKNKTRRKSVSVDDLYQIVKLQNEQIMLLQKQVDRLLEQQNKSPENSKSHKFSKRKSADNLDVCGCNCKLDKSKGQSFKLSMVKENSQIECLQAVEKHNGVSIGVMTSFVEIMQKAQIGQKSTRQKNNDCGETCATYSENSQPNCNPPRSKENSQKRKKSNRTHKQPKGISATTRNSHREVSTVADSFTLNERELPVVREQTPSPECSVHIDIQDYDSSSSLSSASCDDESEPNANSNSWDTNTDSEDLKVGWTLYDNVVGQVNNILQNASAPTQNHNQLAVPSTEDVRKATLEQLRLLGVNFGDVDNTVSKKVTFNQQLYPREEIANDPDLHLNALAKMYLNQDQLHEGAISVANRKELADYNARNGNTNLSYATLCYLERYNIKPGSVNKEKRFEAADNHQIVTGLPNPHPRRLRQKPPQHPYPSPRVLDITALKQQPKLL